MDRIKCFDKELDTIKNDDIRKFAEALLMDAPDYFFRVAASSSGRYHPAISLGLGGLARHTKAVIRFYNHIMGIEQNSNMFTEREIDLGVVACLAHDIQKSGTQDYYNEKSNGGENTVFTVFDHPLLAARYVMEHKGIIPDDEVKYVALAIGSHMGQFNTDKKNPNITLPKPSTEMQKMVHLADYLASRKDIELQFDEAEKTMGVDINEFICPLKKHKGEKLVDVAKNDLPYLKWCYENLNMQEPLKGFVKKLVEG